MAEIKVYHEVTVGGKTLVGDRLVGVTLSDITKVAYCVQEVSIAISNTSQLMWSSGNGGITTFTRGLIISDQDIYVEFRNDDTGTVEFGLFLMEANQPYWFGAKGGFNTTESLDGAALVDNTDFADIDRIEVQNEGSTAAVVSLYLFT